MLSRNELQKIADKKHLSLFNAERDYLLELLLFTVSNHFQRFLVFKGGTALYKFYNLNRFSEDLDFDIVEKKFDLDSLIKEAKQSFALTGMQRTLAEKAEHGTEANIRLTVRGPLYDGRKGSMSRVTLNLSRRERPASLHTEWYSGEYKDIPSFSLSILDLGEIAAEKIRCIMTREKPRDIYDLWFLFNRGVSIDLMVVNKKLKIYNSKFDVHVFLSKVYEKRGMWRRDLENLVLGSLPTFDEVAIELEAWSQTWK